MNKEPNSENYVSQLQAMTDRVAALEKQLEAIAVSKKKVMIFLGSGTLDRAMAAFMVANWAMAAGFEVAMYCTLWGLALIRKQNLLEGNTMLEKAAKVMMKKGPDNAILSQMHMLGMGTAFMKKLMKEHRFSTLKELMDAAADSGMEFYACETMMGIMGVKKEEIQDGVHCVGGLIYIKKMSEAAINLTF